MNTGRRSFMRAVGATMVLNDVPGVGAEFRNSPRTESYLGNLAPILRAIHLDVGFPLDYEHRGGKSLEEWRALGRAEVERTLSYSPKTVPLDLRVEKVLKRDGYETRKISFAGTAHYRIPAYLLVPTRGNAPFPGIVALHDHGGFFYAGKEKLVQLPGEHPAVTQFKQKDYQGRSYADELAKRGYVVLVADSFYWGERRLKYEQAPPDLQARLANLNPQQVEYVKALNLFLFERIMELHTWVEFCGTSWLGIVVYDDRRSVDVLASLPEVDARRLGCLGHSGGGFRATYLAGMDPRIRAATVVCWMTSLPTTLDVTEGVHGGLFDAFGLHAHLDHPDVATLGAPDCAVFVQNAAHDVLFTRAGMDQASNKIGRVYENLGHAERFRVTFYDAPHEFNISMQNDAFAWLQKWLS
jgi:cephalosporin-C deacetylase-like acetyl esterase